MLPRTYIKIDRRSVNCHMHHSIPMCLEKGGPGDAAIGVSAHVNTMFSIYSGIVRARHSQRHHELAAPQHD